MEPTEEQKQRIERLYENESLTDNLTDDDARALLKWAEQQIRSETDGELVAAAVSTANQSGTTGAQELLAQASAFLAQELTASGLDSSRASSESADKMTPPEIGAISIQAQPPTTDPNAALKSSTKPKKSRRKRKQKIK